jgi:Family of unknown function (DUF5946)
VTLEVCPGCGAVLPAIPNGATHRYMESSPACWAAFAALGTTEKPLEGMLFDALIVDAFAVHHPGTPGDQSTQSVAIHLMVLYGVLERGFKPEQALWLRQRPGRPSRTPKHERFHWLTPPDLHSSLTVSAVAAGATPRERSELAEAWIKEVWGLWKPSHEDQIVAWFKRFVIAERL